MLNKEIRFARLVYGLRKFLAAFSTTMESLPLAELNFGLQKSTGPSSGHSFGLPRLDCPGVSLAEVCATCLRCHLACSSLVVEVEYLE